MSKRKSTYEEIAGMSLGYLVGNGNPVDKTVVLENQELIIDLDKDGKVVGVEVIFSTPIRETV